MKFAPKIKFVFLVPMFFFQGWVAEVGAVEAELMGCWVYVEKSGRGDVDRRRAQRGSCGSWAALAGLARWRYYYKMRLGRWFV